MSVRVEFFGIPRERAGCSAREFEASTLGELLKQTADEFPRFAEGCLTENRLREGYLANINGRTFTTDPEASLQDGDCVLIVSADVGG